MPCHYPARAVLSVTPEREALVSMVHRELTGLQGRAQGCAAHGWDLGALPTPPSPCSFPSRCVHHSAFYYASGTGLFATQDSLATNNITSWDSLRGKAVCTQVRRSRRREPHRAAAAGAQRTATVHVGWRMRYPALHAQRGYYSNERVAAEYGVQLLEYDSEAAQVDGLVAGECVVGTRQGLPWASGLGLRGLQRAARCEEHVRLSV